jgi:hypothetical protein
MHRIDTPGNAGGLFIAPNPLTGQQAVLVDSAWLNDVQETLCYPIGQAGIALVKGDYTQLGAAMAYYATHANGAPGTGKFIYFMTNGSDRWLTGSNSTAEPGANVGSDYVIARFSDAGAYIDTPLTIFRQNGIADFLYSPLAPTPAPGDNSTKLATTAFVDTAIAAIPVAPFSQEFISGLTAIGSSSTTVAHTLGVTPKLVQVSLVCISADLGYAVGTELVLPATTGGGEGGGTPFGMGVTKTSASLTARYTASTRILDGAANIITPGNWNFIFRCWA